MVLSTVSLFIGGESEGGETLYIGRVYYNATVTIGKVQPSNGVCYIPFDGKEIRFEEFEILTDSN